MTIGEKIQLYRKQKGLSQDELGQQLLVSRQTISLWEMNKTMPTIDNLLRLKEVLSVTVDEILGEDDGSNSLENTPCESYQFQYSQMELKTINRRINRPVFISFILSFLLFFYFFVSTIVVDEPNGFLLLMTGFFAAINCIQWRAWRRAKKQYRQAEKPLCNRTYRYDIYNHYFVLSVSDHRGTIKTMRIDFADVSKTLETKHLLLVIADGQIFIFKKSELQSNSVVYTLFANPSPSDSPSKLKGFSRVLSIVLFIASIASVFAATVCMAFTTDFVNPLKDMWVFYLFLPIPIASVIFGFVMKRKGYRAVQNIVVGFIVGSLLFIYGSFMFIFSGIYSFDPKPIEETEQMMNIDIPVHSEISTLTYSEDSQSDQREHLHYQSTISFDEENVLEFEKSISNDSKWISRIPSQLVGITTALGNRNADYYIIYNTETGEFNQLPEKDGTYRFIHILYWCDTNMMEIIDYDMEYQTQ